MYIALVSQNKKTSLMSVENYIYNDGLSSSRLSTRFLRPEDAIIWADFYAEPDAVEFLPDAFKKPEVDNAGIWMTRQLNRYENKLFGHQAIIHKETNAFIGQCGLLLQEVDGQPEIEVGYHIFKKYWGNGYAPEAAKLFIDFAFEHQLAPSIISIIDVGNIKSQRVAEKNGLERTHQTIQHGQEVYIYRIEFK
jgi:RimJ/RimL family protein N-acetyltransferase